MRQGLCFCRCFAWFQVLWRDVCENVKAFARALADAELEGQILKMETGSFKLHNVSEIWDEKQFYVRDCYTEIADIMLKKKPPVMSLLGSSGIGKSNFMVYLVWRRFQDSELKDFPVFLHQTDIIHRFQKGEEPKEVDVKTLRSAPAQALYIMDAAIDVEHGGLLPVFVDYLCEARDTGVQHRAFQESRALFWAVLYATMDVDGDAECRGHGLTQAE